MTTAFGQLNEAHGKIKNKTKWRFYWLRGEERERARTQTTREWMPSLIEIPRTLKCVWSYSMWTACDIVRKHASFVLVTIVQSIKSNQIDELMGFISTTFNALIFRWAFISVTWHVIDASTFFRSFECISKTLFRTTFWLASFDIVCILCMCGTCIKYYPSFVHINLVLLYISTTFSTLAFFWSNDAHSSSHFYHRKRTFNLCFAWELHFTAYEFIQFFAHFTSSSWFLYAFSNFSSIIPLLVFGRETEHTTEEKKFFGKSF